MLHSNNKTLLRLFFAILFLCMGSYSSLSVSAQDIPSDIGEAASLAEVENSILFTGCTVNSVVATNLAYEEEVVRLVNEQRAANQLPALVNNPALSNAARYQATDMLQDDYFSHDTMDWANGQLTRRCSFSERVSQYYLGWTALGENAAAGQPIPKEVVKAWMDSPGHRANILSSNYREIGVGFASGSGKFGYYWVQDFGSSNTSSKLDVQTPDMFFIYNQSEGRFYPSEYSLTPINSSSSTTINWQMSTDSAWLYLSTTNGQTPTSTVEIRVNTSQIPAVGSYEGTVTLTAASPLNTIGSPQGIPIHLAVVPDLPEKIYLPIALH